MNSTDHFDIIIAGGGLAGLTMANALLHSAGKGQIKQKLHIALISPQFDEPDGRTTALLAHSIDVLEKIDVWQHAAPKAAKMSVMRIIDNTGRFWHAPETAFKSVEIGLDSFGYNILNKDLGAALKINLGQDSCFTRINDKISNAVRVDDKVIIKLESGKELSSDLLIGADGRNSIVRQSAKEGKAIGIRQWQYPQTAIVLNFSHSHSHYDTSTEFHNKTGPFTIVPLEKRISSLVWVTSPQHAEVIKTLDPDSLNREIEDQMHSILGNTKVITDVQSFNLSGMNAKQMADGRFLLIGEAGHVFPPIGAQGYNLGVRDVETLTQCIGENLYNLDKIAGIYDSKRQNDIISRTVSVDLFNRSLLSDFLPAQALRSASIMAIGQIDPIRKLMMREGVSPGLGIRALGESFKNTGNYFQTNP
jgi:2-octaprenyl-6-methoxyphenol hydroxylase